MSLRQMAAQRPVLAALFAAGSQFLLTFLILKAGKAFAAPEMFGKVKLVAFASTVIFPLVLAQVLGLWRRVGAEFNKLKPEPVFLVTLLSCAVFISMGVNAAARPSFAGESLMQFINAFGEELLFRGVIFALLLGIPKWRAIALNGLLFGAMHLMHGFMDGDWNGALWRAFITSLAGFMFTAVRYRTGSLWLNVLLHMFLNLCIIFTNLKIAGGPNAMLAAEWLVSGFQVALAIFVIATEGRRETQARLSAVPA